jgi:endonuclease/exonuclease/phosphatase family metal-dependent hydrolase
VLRITIGWLMLLASVGCVAEPKPVAPRVSTNAEFDENASSGQLLPSISILAWNVESGGSDPNVIAQQLKELGSPDIVCLSEVGPNNFDLFKSALGATYIAINGTTGRADRLQIIYNSQKFDALQTQELQQYREHTLNNGNHRSPLFVRLAMRGTERQFILMVNHLARGNAELRKLQAIGLREWARDQNAPLIAIGDFNMDFDFPTERGNEAFSEMVRDNIWMWVRPEPLIDTNWADRDNDGIDDYPDSMLDFAFVAGPAKTWSPHCTVIVRPGDFPDDQTTSDHRPIQLIVQPQLAVAEYDP